MSLTTRQERISAMRRAGAVASGSHGTLTVKKGETEYAITGCMIKASDNARSVEEWGADHTRTIRAAIPKLNANGVATLPSAPNADLDLILYDGRTYQIRRVTGEDERHAFWTVEGTAPI